MNQQPIQGSLRMTKQELVSDLQFVQERVLTVSEPQQVKSLGDGQAPRWSVEFTATKEQWAELEPELRKQGIGVSVYEMPDHYYDSMEAERRVLARIEGKTNHRLKVLLAILFIVIAGTLILRAMGYEITWLVAVAVLVLMFPISGLRWRGHS